MNKYFTKAFMVLALLMVFAMGVEAAVTVTINRNFGSADSDYRVRDVSIALDSSYPTGGESLAASVFALATVHNVSCDNNDGYSFMYDYTDSKLLAYGSVNGYQNHLAGVTKPALTLTHTADAGVTQAALPVYAVEGSGTSINALALQSTTNGNTDILASFEETTGVVAPGTPRYVVTDSDSPSGVQVYVNTTGDILEYVSPTGQDGYIIAPIEAVANTIGGYALKIKVHHSATAATGSVLYFDDNGAADVQLFFTDPGAAGGVIPAADIEVIGPNYFSVVDGFSAAQVENATDLSGVTDLKCRIYGK